jgi:enoyl-CoA hydratase
VYLGAALKIGVIGKTVAPNRLPDEVVAWAALRLPNCYPAYASAKRALQATTMVAIHIAARLDRDWLSRGMSDPASQRAHAPPYRELKGGDHLGAARLKTPRHGLVRVMNAGSGAGKSPLLPQLQT